MVTGAVTLVLQFRKGYDEGIAQSRGTEIARDSGNSEGTRERRGDLGLPM